VLETNSDNEYSLSTAALIMYNLDKYDEAKSYYDKAMKINSNLTSILSENELIVFNKLMNNKTKE
jgi:tetratricopeptide (TPR) repeat protein